MATPQRQAAIQKEGRLELALQAYPKNPIFNSYRRSKSVRRSPKTPTMAYNRYTIKTRPYLEETPPYVYRRGKPYTMDIIDGSARYAA